MKIRLLIFILILSAFTFSIKAKNIPKPILFEWNVIQSDSSLNLFLSFRISNDNLVFIKDGDIYKAGLSVNYDIYNEENNLVDRITDKEEVTVEDYSITNSRDFFVEGLTKIKISDGKYKIIPSVNLFFADKDYLLKDFFVDIPTFEKNQIGKPIIVESHLVDCDSNNNLFRLANFDGVLPYSANLFSLLIPLNNSELENISLEIIQENKVIFETDSVEIISENLNLEKCENDIVLSQSTSDKMKYLVLQDVNKFVDEGEFKLKINYDGGNKEFELNSLWINKPRSLRAVKESVLILYDYFDENLIDEVYRADSDSLYLALKKFWKVFDRTPQTKFNEMMNEFYSRIDFANENYSSINKLDGAKSDRGKVYIKFGEPSNSERIFSDHKVVEVWEYEQMNRKFIFTDNSGTGKFELEN